MTVSDELDLPTGPVPVLAVVSVDRAGGCFVWLWW